MTLNSQYSTEQMYNEWINGTPISEIVKKTGIKRKTWNKRFERYENRSDKATNSNLDMIKGEKNENVIVQTGDNSDNVIRLRRNVAGIERNKPINEFFAALGVIAFALAMFLIYTQSKEKRFIADY